MCLKFFPRFILRRLDKYYSPFSAFLELFPIVASLQTVTASLFIQEIYDKPAERNAINNLSGRTDVKYAYYDFQLF